MAEEWAEEWRRRNCYRRSGLPCRLADECVIEEVIEFDSLPGIASQKTLKEHRQLR